MRQGQQNRRGRGRNRKGQSPLTRSFESTGPDVKLRGTPAHIAEKYMSLARDASSSGDPVLAENYLQHAEHYNRIIMAFRDQHVGPGGDGMNGGGRLEPGDEFGDDDGDEGDLQPSMQPMRQNDHQPQPRMDNQRFEGNRGGNDQQRFRDRDRHNNYNRHDRNDRGPDRRERPWPRSRARPRRRAAPLPAVASTADRRRGCRGRQGSSRRRTTRCAGANRASRSRATSSRSSCAGPCVARAAKATVSRMATATATLVPTTRTATRSAARLSADVFCPHGRASSCAPHLLDFSALWRAPEFSGTRRDARQCARLRRA